MSPLKRVLKAIGQVILRDDYPRVQMQIEDFYQRRFFRTTPLSELTQAFVTRHGLTVQAGPFAGLKYPREALELAETPVAKLLGAYECELHEIIENVVASGFRTVVDVGCAEGYYAVGLALRSPDTVVHSYDISRSRRRLCAKTACLNGVRDRVVVHGVCTVDDLQSVTDTPAFVLVDCEGCESDVLRPDVVAMLRCATVLVELHDFLVPGTAATLDQRFAATHAARRVVARPRYPADYPALADVRGLSFVDLQLAVTEFRPVRMEWALYTPHSA